MNSEAGLSSFHSKISVITTPRPHLDLRPSAFVVTALPSNATCTKPELEMRTEHVIVIRV